MTQTRPIKRLYRSRSDKIIGGVAGGLGKYFDIDPVIVRIVWLALVLFGGTGILAYIIAWILIPEEPQYRQYQQGAPAQPESQPQPQQEYMTDRDREKSSRDTSKIIGVILIVIALIWMGSMFGWYFDFPWKWLAPLGLVVLGVALLIRNDAHKKADEEEERSGSQYPTPPSAPHAPAHAPGATVPTPQPGQAAPAPEQPVTAEPSEPESSVEEKPTGGEPEDTPEEPDQPDESKK